MALQSSNVDKSWEPKIPPSLVKTPVTKKKRVTKMEMDGKHNAHVLRFVKAIVAPFMSPRLMPIWAHGMPAT